MSARTAGSRGSSLRAGKLLIQLMLETWLILDRNANEERLHQCEGGMLQVGALQLKILGVEASGKAPVKLLVATGRVGQERGRGVLRGGTGGAGTEIRRSMSRFGLADQIS